MNMKVYSSQLPSPVSERKCNFLKRERYICRTKTMYLITSPRGTENIINNVSLIYNNQMHRTTRISLAHIVNRCVYSVVAGDNLFSL